MKMDKVAGSGNDEFIGKIINNWTIIEVFKINSRLYFKCQCSCENKTIKNVLKSNVLSEKSKSCGCISSKVTSDRNSRVNIFIEKDTHILGIDNSKNEFIIDKELLNKVNQHYWCKTSDGYFVATINKKRISLHRFLLNVEGFRVKIDHINHNVFDNRMNNLRICKHKENLCNSKINKNNKSGHKGIFFNKRYNKWEVSGVYDYKKFYLGRYLNVEEAIVARENWENIYQKEYKYNKEAI